MTNVPTLYNLLQILLFPPMLSFFVGFMIHYIWFRNIKKGLALGLISIGLYFVVLGLFLPRNVNYAGIISGAVIGAARSIVTGGFFSFFARLLKEEKMETGLWRKKDEHMGCILSRMAALEFPMRCK